MFKFCEWGQACSCWFDGIKILNIDWTTACKNHDNRYKNIPITFFKWLYNKLYADKQLGIEVLNSGKWYYTLWIAIAMYLMTSIFGWLWYLRHTYTKVTLK